MTWPTNSRPKGSSLTALDFYALVQLFGNNEQKQYAKEIKAGLDELARTRKELKEVQDSLEREKAARAASLESIEAADIALQKKQADWDNQVFKQKAELKAAKEVIEKQVAQLDKSKQDLQGAQEEQKRQALALSNEKAAWIEYVSGVSKELDKREAAVKASEEAISIKQKKLKEALSA